MALAASSAGEVGQGTEESRGGKAVEVAAPGVGGLWSPRGPCPSAAPARSHAVELYVCFKTGFCRGAGACQPWMRSPGTGYRIVEWFGSEGTFKGHLVQPPCNKQGHLGLDRVAQSPVRPDLECFQASRVPFSPGWTLGRVGWVSSGISLLAAPYPLSHPRSAAKSLGVQHRARAAPTSPGTPDGLTCVRVGGQHPGGGGLSPEVFSKFEGKNQNHWESSRFQSQHRC